MRLNVPLLLLAGLAGPALEGSIRLAAAQPRGETSVLLRRIAAAVDGYRRCGPVWVVANIEYPNDVAAVVPREGMADSVRRSLRDHYDVFGPFRSACDYSGGTLFGLVGKRLNSAADTLPAFSIPTDSVVEVVVTVRTRDGRTLVTRPDPDQLEALFFTMSAVDKFLVPYYTQLVDVGFAERLRARYDSAFLGGRRR